MGLDNILLALVENHTPDHIRYAFDRGIIPHPAMVCNPDVISITLILEFKYFPFVEQVTVIGVFLGRQQRQEHGKFRPVIDLDQFEAVFRTNIDKILIGVIP